MSGSPSLNQPSAKRINNAGWPSITCSDLDEMVFTMLISTVNGATSDYFLLRR